MEATKWLKPSISVSRIGGSASVQAATRVNAEQASKRTMRRLTRQPFRVRPIVCRCLFYKGYLLAKCPGYEILDTLFSLFVRLTGRHYLCQPARCQPLLVGGLGIPFHFLQRQVP